MRLKRRSSRNPPRVIIHGNRLSGLSEDYKRYLENALRERFKLIGTPLALEFREGTNPFAGKVNVLTERQVAKRRRLMKHVKR